jgi:signal peptidase I
MVGAAPARTVIRGLALGAGLLIASRTIAVPVRATGISMMPTYADGQLLFFNTFAYRVTSPKRGDVVAITIEQRQALLVKRVIGLPGERIRIEAGTVYVDDAPLREPYVHLGAPWNVAEARLAADEYFVIGDNRSMAVQHHTFGIVPQRRLFARIVF